MKSEISRKIVLRHSEEPWCIICLCVIRGANGVVSAFAALSERVHLVLVS